MTASQKNPRFGRTLRSLRLDRHLTLEDLARAAGVSITYLSKIEREELPPPSDTKIRLLEEKLGAKGELLPLSGRVPKDLMKAIKRFPKEYSQLLRYTRTLNRDGLHRLLSLIEKSGLLDDSDSKLQGGDFK